MSYVKVNRLCESGRHVVIPCDDIFGFRKKTSSVLDMLSNLGDFRYVSEIEKLRIY